MTDREAEFDRFLSKTEWKDWHANNLAGDASSRSYKRLSKDGKSIIAMDAPPDAAEDTRPFIEIVRYLCSVGLSAPVILAQDTAKGFLILEDLGQDDFASILRGSPFEETALYTAATDVLVHLRRQATPALKQMTPDVAGDMVRIVGEFYVDDSTLSDDLEAEITIAIANLCGLPDVIALRDYHAENLIWRSSEKGLARVGLLDFQDAFLAPDGYDLASLLRDARRDVSADCAETVLTHYAKMTAQPVSEVRDAIACLSVQRNLRILGVFARLIKVAGKQRYGAMLPRVWDHVMRDLDHPALGKLQGLVRKGIPNPSHPSIAKWAT